MTAYNLIVFHRTINYFTRHNSTRLPKMSIGLEILQTKGRATSMPFPRTYGYSILLEIIDLTGFAPAGFLPFAFCNNFIIENFQKQQAISEHFVNYRKGVEGNFPSPTSIYRQSGFSVEAVAPV